MTEAVSRLSSEGLETSEELGQSEGLGKSEGLGNKQHILLYFEHVNNYRPIGFLRF